MAQFNKTRHRHSIERSGCWAGRRWTVGEAELGQWGEAGQLGPSGSRGWRAHARRLALVLSPIPIPIWIAR